MTTDIIKRLQKVSDHAGVLLTDPIRPTAIKAACDEAIRIITDLQAECRRSDNLLEFVINNRPTWQPIETAEHSGDQPDRLLLLEDGSMVVGCFEEGHTWLWTDHRGHDVFPTYWMPLPAPPTQMESARA